MQVAVGDVFFPHHGYVAISGVREDRPSSVHSKAPEAKSSSLLTSDEIGICRKQFTEIQAGHKG